MYYLPETTTDPIQQDADFRLNTISSILGLIEKRARRDGCFGADDVRLLAHLDITLTLWVYDTALRALVA